MALDDFLIEFIHDFNLYYCVTVDEGHGAGDAERVTQECSGGRRQTSRGEEAKCAQTGTRGEVEARRAHAEGQDAPHARR